MNELIPIQYEKGVHLTDPPGGSAYKDDRKNCSCMNKQKLWDKEYGLSDYAGIPVVSSRWVAAKFEKEHKHVLGSIRTLLKPESGLSRRFTEPSFRLSDYKDSTGRKLPEYLLTRDGVVNANGFSNGTTGGISQMNEMITIQYESEKPTVSGRELHAALEIETPYHKWFPRMLEYGFSESKDFRTFLTESSGGRPGTDHAITIPMAKELCMLQRTAKGKQCREYFISCEEAWNSPDKIMERALQIAHRRAIEAERRIFGLLEEKETLEIALNESIQFFTVAKYNGVFKKSWTSAQCQLIGKQLSAYCRARAIQIRKCETNDERFGTVNSYPISAWDDFMEVCEYA